ncbi:hypothetical protein L1887_30030 [Cichorium endivia]|nr:hypothetical protein L1887_30030 [Cichorium endivia]
MYIRLKPNYYLKNLIKLGSKLLDKDWIELVNGVIRLTGPAALCHWWKSLSPFGIHKIPLSPSLPCTTSLETSYVVIELLKDIGHHGSKQQKNSDANGEDGASISGTVDAGGGCGG